MKSNDIEIIQPKKQLNLYGYKDYFNSFKTLYEKRQLPNVVLLSGQKGLGKSTFAYHFINFLLSINETHKYSLENLVINSNNSSFNLIQNRTHPNFFLLDALPGENIKMEQTKDLLKYLNKTTYAQSVKIVLIDNADLLNISSSNSLLKALEEPLGNTFFFIIYNDSSKILDTIKSRCINFKFSFSPEDKKNIFNKINENYQLSCTSQDLDKFLYFDSPGNLLRYLLILKDTNLSISKDTLSCILFLMDLYKTKKDSELLNIITLFVENFYNELSLNNSNNINSYFINRNKILYLINNMNKFHLDKNNFIFTIDKIIKNEKK